MNFITPIGAIIRGLAAGALASYAQTKFFQLTSPYAPESPEDGFEPPEPEQYEENNTETVARRLYEGLAARGAMSSSDKEVGAKAVHYGFGAAWGAVYGLMRESFSPIGSMAGVAAYSATVWHVSDNFLLPAFRLSGPPGRVPAQNHAYALAAHLVYGTTVWATYAVTRVPMGIVLAGAGLAAAGYEVFGRTRPAAFDTSEQEALGFETEVEPEPAPTIQPGTEEPFQELRDEQRERSAGLS